MKKLMVIFVLSLPVSLVMAQGSKVAVVDADVVIQKSVKGKKFFEDYQNFAKGKSGEIEVMVEQYKTQEKDYNAKVASLSEDKRKDLASELQRLSTEIKRKQEDAKRESDDMLETALDQFRKELGPLIRQVALEKNLDLVLNYGPQSNLVFFSDAINITDDVIKKYDETAK